jgi:hypothetical protein
MLLYSPKYEQVRLVCTGDGIYCEYYSHNQTYRQGICLHPHLKNINGLDYTKHIKSHHQLKLQKSILKRSQNYHGTAQQYPKRPNAIDYRDCLLRGKKSFLRIAFLRSQHQLKALREKNWRNARLEN